MYSKLVKKFTGLFRYPSYLAVPEGGFLTARNATFKRSGVVEPLTGMSGLGAGLEKIDLITSAVDGTQRSYPFVAPIFKNFLYKFPSTNGGDKNELNMLWSLFMHDDSNNYITGNLRYKLLRARETAEVLDLGINVSYGTTGQRTSGIREANPLQLRPYSQVEAKNYNGFLYLSYRSKLLEYTYSTNTTAYKNSGTERFVAPTNVSKVKSTSGFLAPGKSVAYKFAFVKTIPERKLEFIGEPSARILVENPYLSLISVSKVYTGPSVTFNTLQVHGLSAGDFVEIINTQIYGSPSSISYATGEITVTLNNHGYSTGDLITFENGSTQELNGSRVITVLTNNTFKFSLTPAITSNLSIGKCYKNKNLLNGTFTVDTVPTTSSFTIKVDQSPNASSEYADNTVKVIDEATSMKYGYFVNVSFDLIKPFNNDSLDNHKVKGYRTETADLEKLLIPSDNYYEFFTGDYNKSSPGSVLDNVPEDLIGTSLYTNENLVDNSPNSKPPSCVSLDVYKDIMFYANADSRGSKKIQLLSTNGISRDGTNYLKIKNNYLYFTDVESSPSATTANFKVYKKIDFTAGTDGAMTYSGGEITVDTDTSHSNIDRKHLLAVGDQVIIAGANENGYNGVYTVKALDGTNPDYKFTVQAVAIPTASTATAATISVSPGTPSQMIEKTAKSLIKQLNNITYASRESVAEYLSVDNGDISLQFPGIIGIFFDFITPTSTDIEVNSGLATYITPNLVAGSKDNFIDIISKTNKVYFSKRFQPESVCYDGSQELDIGGPENEILRFVSLKNSAFFICSEGIYKLVGDDPRSFNVTPVDLTVKGIAPETVQTINNTIYFLSNKGVIALNENGLEIISNQIEYETLKHNTLSIIPFAAGYESKGLYYLFLPNLPNITKLVNQYGSGTGSNTKNDFNNNVFIYDTATEKWSESQIRASSAINAKVVEYYTDTKIQDTTDRLYIGNYGGIVNQGIDSSKYRSSRGNCYLLKDRKATDVEADIVDYKDIGHKIQPTYEDCEYLNPNGSGTTYGEFDYFYKVSFTVDGDYATTTDRSYGYYNQLFVDGIIIQNLDSTAKNKYKFYKILSATYDAGTSKTLVIGYVKKPAWVDSSSPSTIDEAQLAIDFSTSGNTVVYHPIHFELEFKPEDGGDSFDSKTFIESQIYAEANTFSKLSYQFITDLGRSSANEVVQNYDFTARDTDFVTYQSNMKQYGDNTGEISASPVRILIPPQLRRGRVGFLKIIHQMAEEKLSILAVSYIYNKYTKKSTRTSEGTGET